MTICSTRVFFYGYIGDSTKLEIEYAKSLGKDIVYYSDGEFYE